jgi:hypothetical protein
MRNEANLRMDFCCAYAGNESVQLLFCSFFVLRRAIYYILLVQYLGVRAGIEHAI